tara:strand:+ start:124 stop:492 length:369 start_codon:yes stop_codon:yes gene_type:complete
MAIVNITFPFSAHRTNQSIQVGDTIYYSHSGSSNGGINNTNIANTVKLGSVVSISTNGAVTVAYDNALVSPPNPGDFISFAKDKSVNTSSLLGYYASVNFVNDSRKKAELFSVGSEITESSK